MRAHGADVRVHGCEPADLERAAEPRPDRIVVAGGDGTIAPVAALAGRLGVPLGVIPAGTANDFARANGLPADHRAAAVLAVRGAGRRELELGWLSDGRPFVNVASAGLGAVAARRAKRFKRRLGPLAYAVGAVHAAATSRPLQASVRVDGATAFRGAAWQVIVAATGAFGGGSGLGAADPEDGVLDVAVLPGGSRLGLLHRAWGLRRGTIAAQRGVEHHRGALVEVDLPPGAELNADGEIRTGGLDRVSVTRHGFTLVVPSGG
jgi:diacylglycerol kinase family enzyme